MASNLSDVLSEYASSGDFRPYCCHSKDADSLTVYFHPDAEYSKRLTDHVTLLLSMEDDRLVGCRIKGLSGIVEALPNFLKVDLGNLKLSVLFFPFFGDADDNTRDRLRELANAASELPLKIEDCPAS